MSIVEVMMAIKKRCARRNMLCAAAVISLSSFFITATALLTGCSSDKDDMLETYTLADDENTMEITFTITVQDNSTTTRATRDDEETSTESTDNDTWDDDYTSDAGDTYENTIYNIQVLLLNSSNEIIAEVEKKWTTESSTGVYEFVGAISMTAEDNDWGDNCFTISKDDDGDITSAAFNGRIMILANMAENTTYSTTSDGTTTFSEPTYSFSSPSAGGVLSTGIPMFGQKSVEFTLYPGIRTSIDDEIYLLRAMARVELTINNTSSSTNDVYFIGKASIKGYNTSGNIVPSGYYTKASESTSASSVDTEDLSIEGCMNVPTSPGYTRTSETTKDSIVFIKEVEDGDTVCYVYLPEYDYYSDDDSKTVTNTYEPYMDLYIYHRYPVSYTLNETTGLVETTYATEALGKETLYLQEYSNGVASGTGYDLVRNHIYGYELTKTEDSELYVTTTASDWETVTTYLAWDADSTYIMPNASGDGYDDEASRCVLQYPRWGNENSESWHTEDSKSFATYELSVQAENSTRQFTWQAYFTNPDYFYFNTNKSDKDPNSSSSDFYTHGVSCGVGRDSLYTIKIGPYAKGNSVEVTKDGTTYTITTPSNGVWQDIKYYYLLTETGKSHCVYVPGSLCVDTLNIQYDSDGNVTSLDTIMTDTVVAVYTDVFILATSASGTEPLNINHVSWVDALNNFTPYMLAGGTYEQTVSVDTNEDGVEETYTLGERQWFRLWWANSKLSSSDDLTKLYYTTDLLQDIKDAGGCEWYTGK